MSVSKNNGVVCPIDDEICDAIQMLDLTEAEFDETIAEITAPCRVNAAQSRWKNDVFRVLEDLEQVIGPSRSANDFDLLDTIKYMKGLVNGAASEIDSKSDCDYDADCDSDDCEESDSESSYVSTEDLFVSTEVYTSLYYMIPTQSA